MDKKVIFARGGCDLTFINPTSVNISSCIASRYDAGICKHRYERSGVVEIYKINGVDFEKYKTD